MLCLGENEIKGRRKVYLLWLHLISKSFLKKLLGTGFVFCSSIKQKKQCTFEVQQCQNSPGKIYSLKPFCSDPPLHPPPHLPVRMWVGVSLGRAGPSCGSASNRTLTDWRYWCCCRLEPRKSQCGGSGLVSETCQCFHNFYLSFPFLQFPLSHHTVKNFFFFKLWRFLGP